MRQDELCSRTYLTHNGIKTQHNSTAIKWGDNHGNRCCGYESTHIFVIIEPYKYLHTQHITRVHFTHAPTHTQTNTQAHTHTHLDIRRRNTHVQELIIIPQDQYTHAAFQATQGINGQVFTHSYQEGFIHCNQLITSL